MDDGKDEGLWIKRKALEITRLSQAVPTANSSLSARTTAWTAASRSKPCVPAMRDRVRCAQITPARARAPPPSPVLVGAGDGDARTIKLVTIISSQLSIALSPWPKFGIERKRSAAINRTLLNSLSFQYIGASVPSEDERKD